MTTNLDIEVPSDSKVKNQVDRPQILHKSFEYNPNLNRNILGELPKNTQFSELNRSNTGLDSSGYRLKTPEAKTEKLFNVLDVRINKI